MSNIWSLRRDKAEDEEEKKSVELERELVHHARHRAGEKGQKIIKYEGKLSSENVDDDEVSSSSTSTTSSSNSNKKRKKKLFNLLRRSNSEKSSTSNLSILSEESNQKRSILDFMRIRSHPSRSHSPSTTKDKVAKFMKQPIILKRNVVSSARSKDSVESNPEQEGNLITNTVVENLDTNQAIDDTNDNYRLEVISNKFPCTTLMERKRFLAHRTLERAEEKLEHYMAWRKAYCLDSTDFQNCPTFKSDGDTWDWVVGYAARHYKAKNGNPISGIGDDSQVNSLPRIVRFGDDTDLKATEGRRIVQVLPGILDKSIAPQEFYALCVAIYLDVKLGRHSDEDIYVLVDVRAGRNWPNAPPTVLIPFVKQLTKQLEDNFPERMHHCVVYPIPSPAKLIWAMFKTFLHPKIVTKIDIMWGPAGVDSPTPEGILNEILDEETLAKVDENRLSEFR